MRTIKVHRKKQFRASLAPYWVIVSMSKSEFCTKHEIVGDMSEMMNNGIPVPRVKASDLEKCGKRISSGQVLELEVPDDAISLFVSTMDGTLSNEVDIRFTDEVEIITKGGLTRIAYPVVK